MRQAVSKKQIILTFKHFIYMTGEFHSIKMKFQGTKKTHKKTNNINQKRNDFCCCNKQDLHNFIQQFTGNMIVP